MNHNEYRQGVAAILYMMAEVFRDKMSDALIDGWVAVLGSEEVTIEEAKVAAIEVMKSREYNKLPAPAVFLEILRPKFGPQEIAETQADRVIEAVRKVGSYGKPRFDDPITTELMAEHWNWQPFARNLKEDQVSWWRKEFVEAYCGMAKRELRLLPEPKPKELAEGKLGTQPKEG